MNTLPDYFSLGGALRLKAIIEAYWKRRGLVPAVHVIKQAAPHGRDGEEERPMYVVRSNITFDSRGYPKVKA